VTAEANQKNSQAQGEDKKGIHAITDAWKKMYYESEEVLARSMDEYVAGQSFTDLLEQMGNQYLTAYQATTHNTDRLFANNPLPTKKDIARVCELVIAVEEKVDHLESDFNGNMAGMASSLIRLVDFQVVLKDELLTIHKEVDSMRSQLIQMQEKISGLEVPAVKTAAKSVAESPLTDPKDARSAGEVQSKPIQKDNKQTLTAQTPRPRSRTLKGDK
jgi:polyhydroxyalkanoic acid synthase PhaR subunit